MKITAQMVKELRDKTDAAMMSCKKALEQTSGNIEAAIEYLRKAGIAKAEKRASKTAAEGKIAVALSTAGDCAYMVEINSETDFVARDQNFNGFLSEVINAGLSHKANSVESTLNINLEGKTLEEKRQELVSKIGENVQLRRCTYMEATGCVGHYLHGDRIGVLVELDSKNPELAKDIAMHIAASTPEALNPEDVSQELIAKEQEIFKAQAQESGKPDDIIDKMVAGRINKFLKEVSLTNQPFVKDPSISVADLLKAHNAKVVKFVRYEVGEGIEKETQNFADEVMAQAKGKN